MLTSFQATAARPTFLAFWDQCHAHLRYIPSPRKISSWYIF